MPVASPTGKRLLVPWIGQNVDSVTTDDYTKSDCGAACMAMVINTFRGGDGVTVDEVSVATGRPKGYFAASFQELINAGARYNVLLEHVSPTLENICADIDNGRPVIVIVNYKSMPQYNRLTLPTTQGITFSSSATKMVVSCTMTPTGKALTVARIAV